MARLGMDVDAVESLGRQLTSQGHQVRTIIRAVDGQIGHAGVHWWGTRGREFVEHWRSRQRPALLRLADEIEGLGRSALDNARAQRQASDAGAGFSGSGFQTAGGRPVPGGPDLPGFDLTQGFKNLDLLHEHLDVLYTPITSFLGVTGILTTTARGTAYPKLYRSLFGGAGFMRYNRSLQHTYSPLMNKLMKSPAMGGLDIFGKGLTVVSSTADVYRTFFGARSGEATTARKIEVGGSTLGSALKMTRNPVAYLAGANVTAWSMVAAEASKIDLSAEARSTTWNYVKQNPGALVEEFGSAAKDMFTDRIWKIFG